MIRKATLEDVPHIVRMGERLHHESSFSSISYCGERVAQIASVLISNGFAVVVEKDGEVIGGMMGDVVVPWYSTERMGIDYSLYIEPEHRNGMLAVKLVKMFEEWCLTMGAVQIRPGVSTGHMSAGKLYRALGYEQVGECFVKNIRG